MQTLPVYRHTNKFCLGGASIDVPPFPPREEPVSFHMEIDFTIPLAHTNLYFFDFFIWTACNNLPALIYNELSQVFNICLFTTVRESWF